LITSAKVHENKFPRTNADVIKIQKYFLFIFCVKIFFILKHNT